MNLECLNSIITDNLAIQIDLTKLESWDLNTGFTSYSLNKWSGAVSDNINLIDFGLTGFDNGRTNVMWDGINLTPDDTLFNMYRVGYNNIQNPTSGETSGMTITTVYDPYNISGVTSGDTGNYFELNGGYLQGFFKLQDYNYELLPSRFNNGITVETLVNIYPNSSGIFYMMGLRTDDKYNEFFSGEVSTGGTSGNVTIVDGINTSENNYLDSFYEESVNKKAFRTWETRKNIENKSAPAIDNVKGNAIAFFMTEDKRIGYKYVNNNGLIVENTSPTPITATGFTMIAVAFTPDSIIDTIDPDLFLCAPQRTGKLIFYINGRANWIVKDFPEYFFKGLNNQREKQIGVPYSISWGGGSFGLRYSYHYDYQKYGLYTGQDTNYIDDMFWVQNNPFADECDVPESDDYLPGLSLSADTTTFTIKDSCDSSIENPLTVMRVEYTGMTGTSAMTYFIKFNQPISILSNRNYEINLSFFNNGFFKEYNDNEYQTNNSASIVLYGTTDIDIIDETEYVMPLTMADILKLNGSGLYPFPDRDEFQYVRNETMYYGATGMPILAEEDIIYGVTPLDTEIQSSLVTGENGWKPLKTIFRTKENSGQQWVYMGILLKSSVTFNSNKPIFINNFTYKGADILVQDPTKENLLIEQNFDSSFIGGIQKLRVYNSALTSPEILHNAYMESKLNPNLNMKINKGGRIIYR